jgi:hypothetical protein
VNPATNVFPAACCGVRERVGKIVIPYGSKILRIALWKASIIGDMTEGM